MQTAAIDIETTGIEPDDQITVIGIDTSAGSSLFLNTDGRTYDETATDRIRADFEPTLTVTACESEPTLLQTVREFTEDQFASPDEADGRSEFKYAAFNGETYSGGFDLPFIRTRCRTHGIPWPFHGPYIDAMSVIADRFNVSEGSLETTYAELVGEGLTDRDPFEDSGEAVDSWRAGEFEALLRHNLADIRRTRALVAVAERYCSSSHFSMRSLDPIDP